MDLILDTNVLIKRPTLLSLGGDAVRFFIPEVVFDELSRGRFADTISDLLKRASNAGRLVILPPPSSTARDLSRLPRLDATDGQILQTALEYQRDNADAKVFLVSDDMPLVMQAAKLGL